MTDANSPAGYLPSGSIFTITGGTGSFGSTMARHLLSRGAAEVRIVSRDEAKQDLMRTQLNDGRLKFYLGDTRNAESLRQPIRGADYVFHAAALKQVPSAEFFPMEAVSTNVLGSWNVLRQALDEAVKGVVCLSTDKAVYPINAMGMTKALMEKSAGALARENLTAKTVISTTRYGNVMYSRGSVIPRFISQIKNGGPITLTDPNMTRFLMSLEESVALVEHAFSNAKSGDLFVKKAPAATIGDIASALVQIFGSRKIETVQIGYRHGEKLFESLLSSEEMRTAVDEGDYFRLPLDARDLNYEVFFEQGDSSSEVLNSYHSHNTHRLQGDELVALLLDLPEIRSEVAG